MNGIDEHADGELGDVPAATDATPSVSTGNVSRLRKLLHSLEHKSGSETFAIFSALGHNAVEQE